VLIEKYDLEVYAPPCDPKAKRFIGHARFSIDISEVLPYLNATLKGAIYLAEAKALTWKKSKHDVAFHAHEILTSNIKDHAGAEMEMQELISLVNHTWENRAEIVPKHTSYQRPAPMIVYKLLPLTNCRQCGESTCYIFALKLTASLKQLSDCPSLADPKNAEKLAVLQNIMKDAPSINQGMNKSAVRPDSTDTRKDR
jgi:ArsR family metal-binding transcriptional regulator